MDPFCSSARRGRDAVFRKDTGMPDRFRHPRLCLLADAERRGSDSGFSKKVLSHFFLTGSGQRMSLYRRLIEDYRIDGAVFFYASRLPGDPRSFLGAANDSRREKIPFLELPGDCIDPRGFSSEQVMLRMEAFRESMDLHTNRKRREGCIGGLTVAQRRSMFSC